MKYLVVGSGGPGFASPEEAAEVLQSVILPTFKQIIEAIKELVTDANLDCNEDEISMQCMDSAHVSLVAMQLSSAAFDHFRCDRPLALGINNANMSKILKMMGKEDILVLKAEDDGDKLMMMFENEKTGTIADFGKCIFRLRYKTVITL